MFPIKINLRGLYLNNKVEKGIHVQEARSICLLYYVILKVNENAASLQVSTVQPEIIIVIWKTCVT